MDRLSVIRKCIRYFTHDSLTNGLLLKGQLEYLTKEYKKLDKAYSTSKLSEECNEVIECLSSLSNIIDKCYSDNRIEHTNKLNQYKDEFKAKLLGLLLEISDLILVVSYLDSIYNTDYASKYIPQVVNSIEELDNKIQISKFKVFNLLRMGSVSILTQTLEYKVKELYIAKQLGNGICNDTKYNKYEMIFHTLYPNKNLIDEDNYKMIRKWIFVDNFDFLISNLTVVLK